MKPKNMVLLLTTTMMGLIAGLFFCWSISVTNGLAPLGDREYILAFQSLNRKIQNPVFFSCFMGLVLMLPLSTWLQYERPVPTRFWLLLAASLLYIVGVIGITAVGNIPMNDAMDVFNVDAASAAGITAKRIAFEAPWNRLNNIRTLICIVCLVLTILACMIPRHSTGFDPS